VTTEPGLEVIFDVADEGLARGPDVAGDRRAVWIGSLLGAAVLLAVTIPRLNRNALWLDEAFSLGAAHQFVATVRATGATMSIYYLFLVPWVKVSAAAWWLRLPSMLFALATLPLVATLGRRVGGRRLAVVAPPLLALVYLFGVKAAEARAYSLETLLVTIGWYSVIRIVDLGAATHAARGWWGLLVLLAFVGPLAHGLFPLFVLAWLAAFSLSPIPRPALLRSVPIVGATALVLLLLDVHGATQVGDWVPPTDLHRVVLAVHHFTSTNRVVSVVLAVLVLVSWVLAALAYVRSRAATDDDVRLQAWRGVLPLVAVAAPGATLLVVSVVRPEFLDRYLAPATPMVALALGSGVLAVADRVGRWAGRPEQPAFAAVGVVVVFALLAASQPAVSHGTYEDWRAATRFVAAGARPGDGLILYSQFERPPFEAAWSEIGHPPDLTVVNTTRPRLGEVERNDVFLSATTVRGRLASHDRVWVVERWYEPGYANFMLASGLSTDFRLARRATVSVPDWGVDVTLYVRRGSPADTSP
jgi:mannosyltransferase